MMKRIIIILPMLAASIDALGFAPEIKIIPTTGKPSRPSFAKPAKTRPCLRKMKRITGADWMWIRNNGNIKVFAFARAA